MSLAFVISIVRSSSLPLKQFEQFLPDPGLKNPLLLRPLQDAPAENLLGAAAKAGVA